MADSSITHLKKSSTPFIVILTTDSETKKVRACLTHTLTIHMF